MNILWFLGLVAGGIGLVVYAYPIVHTFGHLDWAERYLGTGGSYSAWKLAGILMIIGGFWVLVNGF